MTKHLRILLIALFAMVCMGGISQTEKPYKTLSFPDDNKENNKVESTKAYSSTWTASLGGFEWSIANFNNNQWNSSWTYIRCGSKNNASTASISTATAMDVAISKIVVNYPNSDDYKKGDLSKVNSLKLLVSSDDAFSNVIETITDEALSKGSTTSTFTISNPASGLYYKVIFDCAKASANGPVQVNSVDYYQKSNKTATTTSFVGLSGTGVVLNNGKQSDGSDFTGYTAAEEDEVAGTITYAASGDGVATVDATTGKVTVNGDVYGTTTITATFTPTDADTYLGSEASYTIDNKGTKTYASIEALRADLDNGTLKVTPNVTVKLTMTNAKVVYANTWTSKSVTYKQYFVREGGAAVAFYQTDIPFESSAVVSGTFTGGLADQNGMACLTKSDATVVSDVTIASSTTVADPIEISTDDVAKHVCDLVSVKGAKVTKSGSNMIVSNGSGDGAIFYNKFKSSTTSVKNPYVGANIDLTSAIVLPYKATDEAALVYDLAPTEKYTVIYNLSEDDATSAVGAHQDVPVSLKRTFVKDEWNTLCLPFAVTADQLKKLLGDDVQVRTLSAVDGNKLTFAEATALDAETPCLVKLSTINEDNTYTIEGVDLVSTDDGRKKTTGDITFAGIYAQTDVTTEATGTPLFLGTGNKFYQAKADTKMQAFRAYFDVTTTTDPESLKAVIDGETTGIDTINGGAVVGNGRVYNLNGQYVGTSLQKLQPGVYVQNGKKVVIR